MDDIRIKKDELIARMTENRESHRALFLEAQDGYRQAIIDELEAELKRAREGRTPVWKAVSLPVPKDHTKDYDAVLDMLEMEVREEIELSPSDFRKYVRDEWQWREEFIGTTQMYNNG